MWKTSRLGPWKCIPCCRKRSWHAQIPPSRSRLRDRIQLSRSRLFATLPTLWECLVPVSLLQDYTEPPDKLPTRTRGSTGGTVNVEPGVVLRVRTL